MKVPDTDENYSKCACYSGYCLTYEVNKLSGGLFCARGKSEKAAKSIRCDCPGCPVWAEYNLSDYDYCITGAAQDQA
jgi:hypothetical protein